MSKHTPLQSFAAKSLRAAGIEEFSVRLVDLPDGYGCGWFPTRNVLLVAQNLPAVQVRTDIQAVCKMLAQSPPEAL